MNQNLYQCIVYAICAIAFVILAVVSKPSMELCSIICHFISSQWDSLFQREVKLQNEASYDTVDDS